MRALLSRFIRLSLIVVLLAPLTAVADWQYDAFEGDWIQLPDFDSLTPVASGVVTLISTAPRTRNDQFGLRFRAQITVDNPGNYTFATNSDDGSQLLIDGEVVVDNDGLHGPRSISSVRFLDAGNFDLEVIMFEQGGGELIEASYAPPGGGFRAIPGGGTLAGPPDPSQTGSWGPIIPWTFVPVSAANLPDGRVITWASNERYSFPGGRPEFTYTGIWDPSDNSILEIDHPAHDMFCAHQVMLENGQVFVSGGRNSGNSPWTSVFDINTNQWVPLNNMNRGRWYPTSLALADGTVFTAIGSGGGTTGEVYDPNTGSWNILSGLNFEQLILKYQSNEYGESNWWPLFGLMPDGRVFHAGPTPQMHIIDTGGVGSATTTNPEFTDWYPKHGTTVMYDEGKMITAGGWETGTSITSTNEAHIIDLNQPTPTVTPTDPMIYPRKFHNGVMLPNGEVLAVGGNTSGQKFNDSGTVYPVEIWDPATENWREGAAMSVPRNYHSIALLLTDGTVLSAGGGLCNCSADHPDGQIFFPPYLYNSDGSLATRPSILTAPAAIRTGDTFDVTTDDDITHFSLIKMSSTTHAVNTDLRYLSVDFTGSGGVYELTAHNNPNVLTPGYWMLFALNANGTPSISKVVQVRAENTSDPTPIATANFDFLSFADTSAFQFNGSAVGTGGVARLTPAITGLAGSLFHRTPVIVESTTAFSTSFTFSSNGVADGAEGLTFIIQGNESTTLGEGDSGLGYRFVPNSLVVEFDTTDNAAGDTDGNHIAIHVAGDSESPLASTNAPFDLEDGATHRAWVEYSSELDELNVYLALDPASSRPASPVLTGGGIDLLSTIGSLGYFGFSASTGTEANNHDIHAWSLNTTVGESPLAIDPVVATPQPIDGPVLFSASATGIALEYSWSFGDGTPQTPFSTSPDISHNYAAPGRYVVTLIVRDGSGGEQSIQFIQAVYPPLTAQRPVSSTTIFSESVTGSERVWNVNPDNNTVTVIDGLVGTKLAEISVGADPRSLTLAPDNTMWVANKDDATITVIDVSSLTVSDTRSLPRASRPHGIVAHESSGNVYVSLEQLGVVRKLSTTDAGFWADVDVGPNPRHLSITGDESRLYVSRFITPPLPGEHTLAPETTIDGSTPAGGEVIAVDPSTMTMQSTIVLQYSDRQPAEITGPGFPNYLGPAIISPSGQSAWVPSKQDDILRGLSRNGSPLNHDHTVRAVTSVIDLATETENFGFRVDHDNSSTARNGVFDPNGVYLFVALEGNREVVVIDAFVHQEILRFDVGFAPQAVATSSDGTRVYVHNFMSRSVSVVDTFDLINGMSESVSVIATIDTTAAEALSPDVLLGKQLFYDARDPRLSLESYMSCASCHNDGGHDGRVWDLSSMGEGLRNTISLKGHGGMDHGPLHWSANFDEVQDFENQIRELAGGTGLMSDADFTATEAVLGAPKAGLNANLDALAAYVESLSMVEDSPFRSTDGSLTVDGVAGEAIFESTGCVNCHSATFLTDSAPGVRHDIGTITTASGRRLGSTEDPIVEIDTPTLRGLWATAPYLHDGSAGTLQEAVLAHDSSALGGASFTSPELDQLAAYLAQIDSQECPCSVWDATTVPAVPSASDTTAYELGVKFRATTNGYITGVRFYKGAGNTGQHVGNLWTDSGTSLATAIFTNETATGWQQVDFAAPVPVTANTVYVASYYAPNGGFAFDTSYFADSGLNAGLLYLLQNGENGGNGVFVAGPASAFPTSSYNATNYYVDVVFSDNTDPVVAVPDVVGTTQTAAEAALTTAGLTVGTVTRAYSGTVPLDSVISQDPNGGTQVPDGSAIDLVVSDGPPPPDGTPPTVPTGLSATVVGPFQVDLSWTASTDSESGVGGYRVYVDGTDSGVTTATTFSVTGLAANTSYSFTVSAFDNAVPVNPSAQSAAVSATTDTDGCPCNVWDASTVPAVPSASDTTAYELGVKFRATTDGYITGVRFYKGAGNTGQHVGNLWTESGTSLATAIFTNETATGWQQVDFAAPVPVTANTVYVASYYAPNGGYAFDTGYFAASGVDAGLLYLLQNGENGGNGVFVAGPASAFPTSSYNATNYYVDVVFSNDPGSLVAVPNVVGTTQTAAEAALTTAGLTVGTVTRAYSGTVPLDSVISQDPNGGTQVPDGSAIDLVVSDGPPPPDGTPPTVPTGLSATVVGPFQVDLSWTASTDSESGVGGYRVYVDGTDSGVTTATTFSVTGLAANTSYSFTVSAFDNAVPVNPSAQSAAVSATTDTDGCPCNVWDASTVPAVPSASDTTAYELGVKFRATTDGYITGVRFYKGAGNTGQHVGNLWTESGTSLATAIFTNETATGWQQVDFAAPVPVTANTVYVASYYAPNGGYAFDTGYFAASGVDAGLLYLLQNGENGGNGVFVAGPASAFPTSSYNATNYYVDVVFSNDPGSLVAVPNVVGTTQTAAEAALTTAGLTVGTVTRAYSGTVPLDSVISQDPNGGTQVPDGSAIDLVVSDGPPPPDGTPPTVPTGLSATVVGPFQVDLSWTASTDSESGVGGYRVYVDGTDSGVTTATTFSVTGLAANTSYSFTVSAFDNAVPVNPSAQSAAVSATTDTDGCPCNVWDASTVPAVPSASDTTAYELGVKFRATTDGYITGVRFYKGAGNTGQHVGNLWTESGTSLATAIFTNETATGWQQVDFAAPVPVTANTVYVASYYAPNGGFAFDTGYFAASGVDAGLLYLLQNGENGGNGVFVAGPASAFPTSSYNATNYYVDVVFSN